MPKKRILASFGGVALAAALACGTLAYGAASAGAAEAATVTQAAGVHGVYCQTPQFDSYVKFNVTGITPGGGPLCYTGIGTAPIDLHGVTQFRSGAHSGSFQYRYRPGLPIVFRPFAPGQTQQFVQPVEVLSLTITS